MIEFKIPEIAEDIETGTVVSVFVSVGDQVKKDQDLFELETEKASLPIPSPCDGTIKDILIKAGEDVKVGQTVMKIDDGVQGETEPSSADTSPSSEERQTQESPSAAEENSKKEKAKSEASDSPDKKKPSEQSNPQVETEKESKDADTEHVKRPQETVGRPSEDIPAQTDVPAAPSVRRFAREIGIEISQVRGTEAGGRISEDDVKAYAKRLLAGMQTTGKTQQAAAPLPDFSKWGDVERKAMSNVRKKTATHLSTCWQTIPHVTHFDKADITDLEKLRKEYSTKERKLTVTPFLVKILAAALKEFPQFNSSVDMSAMEIVIKKYVHVGIAIDTERGLLVPVIRDADTKTIMELNDELNDITQKAHERKVSLADLKGGCVTLTNLGGIGGTGFAPIVNWPEVAILGVARGRWEPHYTNSQFVPRFILPLCLSYDHRIIDGADGARFLRWIVEAIERPLFMELDQ